MKQNSFLLLAISFILLVVSACSSAPVQIDPTSTPQPVEVTPEPEAAPLQTEPVVDTAPVILTIVNGEQQMEFTLEELKALPASSGQAGMLSSTGKITVPALFTGVLLTDLVNLVGGITPELGVNIVAGDGYAMTLSYEQVMNGGFITYDPSDGTEKSFDEPLQAMVAYEMNGEPLDESSDGILRMVIISSKNNQITDGHWAVKWVERIEVQPVSQEWTLSLSGNLEEVIDRNTFQSCGSVSCHQETWTDDEGQIWAGVPLYLLAGRVDDEVKHEGPAYNRDLANAGYDIELTAADGYTETLTSSDVYYNRKIMVAYLVNDAQLPDKYFPLRLVGDDLEKGQRVGAISEIRLLMDEVNALLAQETTPEPATEPAAEIAIIEPPEGTTLSITGQAVNPLYLNDAAMHALTAVKLTVKHPKRGPEEYEGIYLNTLLNFAVPKTGATSLLFTASDGYSTSVDLAAVQNCEDCLLTFCENEGSYDLAMPGFETFVWIKGLVGIEIQ